VATSSVAWLVRGVSVRAALPRAARSASVGCVTCGAGSLDVIATS
jgi:hypothetical protein